MNYTSKQRSPEAYVSVGKNKNRLKIYNGKNVFLKDGEEFQIELFNPTTKTIGAKILINGNSISNSLLVIKPGERAYLERYLDDNRKFVFETYEVEKSKEAKEAIKDNGGIRVEFYNEKTPAPIYYGGTTYFTNSPTITINPPAYYNTPFYYVTPNTGTPINDNFIVCGSSTSIVNCSGSSTTTSYVANTSGMNLTAGTSLTSGISGTVELDASISPKIETGRIEKGDVSNQKFDNYFGDFEAYYFASVEYKLLPSSQKPIEMKDIRQYCPGCRNRIKKSSWKFCPSCGETLD